MDLEGIDLKVCSARTCTGFQACLGSSPRHWVPKGVAPSGPEPHLWLLPRQCTPRASSPTHLQIQDPIHRDSEKLTAALQAHDSLQGSVAKRDRVSLL